jgi:esterase/lipase superfamily enzyme
MDPFTALTLALTAGDWIIGAIQRSKAGDPSLEQQKEDVGDVSALDAADARWHGTASAPPDVALVRANLAAQPDAARHHLESLAAVARGEVVPPPVDAEKVAALTAENSRLQRSVDELAERLARAQAGEPEGA